MQEFADSFQRFSEFEVSITYLKGAHVRVFKKNNKLVGGYALNSTIPFRYFSFPFVKNEHTNNPKIPPLSETVEGTCIWMDKSLTTMQRIYVYIFLTADFFRSGRKYFLGGTIHPKVRKMQMTALSKYIFSIELDDGRKYHYYYGSRKDAVFALARWLLKRSRKLFDRKKEQSKPY
ncbi:hypothetical protein [Pleionea sediminis]|uniref:hypothetical protein n=1 Tax=Pleionea sediminis TaxID=2569479 RepID=UPI0011857D47|nr:hypothetical protein [Pleionea sediminis]